MPAAPEGKLREIAAAPFLGMYVTGRTVVFSESNKLRLFDLDTGIEGKALPCEGHFAVGHGVLVRAAKRNEPQVADLSGKIRAKLAKPKADSFMISAASIDRAGTLVGGSLVYEGVIWDAKTGKVRLEHHQKAAVDSTEISPDGKLAVIVRAKQPTLLVDTTTLAITPLPDVKPKTLCKVAWSGDSKIVVVYTYTEAIVVDVKSRTAVARHKLNHATRAAFVPKRDVFLVGGYKRITVFDTKTWKQRGAIEVPADLIAATDDGDRIVLGEKTGISVWDASKLLGSGAPVVKKARSKRPAKRQVRAVFFGVPKRVPAKKIIDAVASLHYILDNQPPQFAVRILPAGTARDRHWFHIVGTRGRTYRLDPWIECMQTDFKTPLDVVMHVDISKRVEARRYTTPWTCTDITVEPDYLAALDIGDPVLVIDDHRRAKKRVTPDSISSLVHCVELSWP